MLLAAVAACSEETPDVDAAALPDRYAGETDQGRRVVVERIDDQVRIRLAVDCDQVGAVDATAGRMVLDGHVFSAALEGDGSFVAEEQFVQPGTDGDEIHVEVTIEGTLGEDSATGSFTGGQAHVNAQLPRADRTCRTGDLSWNIPPRAAPRVVERRSVERLISLFHRDGSVWALDHDNVATRLHPDDADEPKRVPLAQADPYRAGEAFTGDTVWTLGGPASRNGIVRTDLTSGATSFLDIDAMHVAYGHGALWVETFVAGEHPTFWLERRDPITGELHARAQAKSGHLVLDDRAVWIVDDHAVSGFDPETLTPVETYEGPGETVHALAGAGSDLWILTVDRLLHIDTESGARTDLDIQGSVLATDRQGVWVGQEREGAVRRIERDRVVDTIDVGFGLADIALDATGALWAAHLFDETVVRIER